MRKMKDSGIDWVQDMPFHWDCKKGKYILNYVQKPVKSDDGVITCFRNGEVTLRSNRREDGFTMADKEIGYQGIDVGDLVVHGMDGFAGAIGISDSRGKASPVLNVLETAENKRYIMYYLRSMAYSDVFLALATGIRVRSCDLRWNKLSELMYPVPPLQEQNCIVDFLDTKLGEIDSLTADIQAQIDTLEQYKRSVITEAVTKGLNSDVDMKDSGYEWIGEIPKEWKISPLKYNYSIISGATPESSNADNWDGDIAWITPADYKTKDVYISKGSRTLSQLGYKSCSANILPKGSIIFSKRAPIGSVAISSSELCTNQGCLGLVKCNETIDNKYFYYVLSIYTEVFNLYGSGTTFKEISANVFKNIMLPYPAVVIQEQIAAYLDSKCSEIDVIIDQKKEQLDVLADYKKSLIYEYVTGKKEVPQAVSDQEPVFDPQVILLGLIINKLGNYIRGKIQIQKMLYLTNEHIGLNRGVQYYRYAHGPYDLQLEQYVDVLVSNHWYEEKHQGADLLVAGRNHADFMEKYGNHFHDEQAEIDKLVAFLRPMKTSQVERIATLFAAWNDFIIDGNPAPTEKQIIYEVMTNWTDNKANTQYATWQGTLKKMKQYGIVPQGLGLHTLPKE